jgi:penicillin-binding protein 1B
MFDLKWRLRPVWKAMRRRPLIAAFAILLFLFVLFVFYLDRSITNRFEGRRWDLPAQVYARPLELYVGLALTPEAFEQELRRLGYRPHEDLPRRPGSFRQSRGRIELVTRSFQFWDELQGSKSLTIEFDDNRISNLRAQDENIPIVRIDPMLVGSIFPGDGEDRLIVTPDQVPALLTAALKVVEDRRFDWHFGVDPIAILRAFVANIRAGEVTQGGSTMTQQLVKSYFLDNRQTLWRKIREAFMAVILEMHFEKDDLMNAYVNEIYLGQDGNRAIHGFGLASQFYFSKPLGELKLHEIALLVALVRGPAYYDPRRYPERALERRALVLRLMAEFGVLTDTEARDAAARELDIWDTRVAGASYYPAFLQLVRRQLIAQYREEDLTSEGLRVFTALDPLVQATVERRLEGGLDTIELRRTPDGQRPIEIPAGEALTGAAVVTSTQSGEVLAIVGGRQAGFGGFNRALDARRTIGSLIKPVVYLAALQAGEHTLASVIDDEEIIVPLDTGDVWTPQNFSGEPHGPVSLLRALVESFNMATVRLGVEIGVERVADLLLRLGMPRPVNPYPSLLLGAVEMAPIEVAQVYNTLANGGFRTPFRAVRSVVDATGDPLERYPIEIVEVANPGAVYQLNQGLVEVINRGTGRGARNRLPRKLIAAGKTGTSDDFRDSWFAGFTGEHVMVVWVGYDDNRSTGLTGAGGALKIWASIMGDLSSTSYDPAPPSDLEEKWIDYGTGSLTKGNCKNAVRLALPPDTQLRRRSGCSLDISRMGQRTMEWLEDVIN